jgi:hypothetical protein
LSVFNSLKTQEPAPPKSESLTITNVVKASSPVVNNVTIRSDGAVSLSSPCISGKTIHIFRRRQENAIQVKQRHDWLCVSPGILNVSAPRYGTWFRDQKPMRSHDVGLAYTK